VNHSIRPVARKDILQQFRYYLIEKDAEDAALRFLEAVQQAIEEASLHAEAGAPKRLENPALQGLRTWPVKGFPSMRIYYLCNQSTLRVVRVLHGKRDLNPMLEESEGPF
jgi:toxin ParE1/3/4